MSICKKCMTIGYSGSLKFDPISLTGHHPECPEYPKNLTESWLKLIKKLVQGMEDWASDEDGIHPDAWEGYEQAKGVLGEFCDLSNSA